MTKHIISQNKDIIYKHYLEWCQNNRCLNKKCVSNKHLICEDYRGIQDCKAHID